ncbi:coenzyme F420-0:L-glutamate ligase [Aminobacter niigataensis]|uniref:coenzyme F420-0:L-glutamate ligase n=1 Tax=Aminobacter niigataensis TaxID=83265 RepID=UPI0024C90B08|nr:coenzyme F420-0:L-glutamate ligase [Aminobacter niigataensis]CAI2931849.1 Coenzyme F420:L-glutamate ligase [Aminobacter niigataensis]
MQPPSRHVSLFALSPFPLVDSGDDLAEMSLQALAAQHIEVLDGDILVYAQKIVSKVEARRRRLADVIPSNEAKALAITVRKDARLVELILGESQEIVRAVPDILVVRHRLGFVLANAGIDASNVGSPDGDEHVLLLPENPDASAVRLLTALASATNRRLAVIINDSFGRAWRIGTTGTAIGVAGISPVADLRGTRDLFGRQLQSTEVGLADEIAAAASLIQGQSSEGTPVVLVRGLEWRAANGGATALVRSRQMDLFR